MKKVLIVITLMFVVFCSKDNENPMSSNKETTLTVYLTSDRLVPLELFLNGEPIGTIQDTCTQLNSEKHPRYNFVSILVESGDYNIQGNWKGFEAFNRPLVVSEGRNIVSVSVEECPDGFNLQDVRFNVLHEYQITGGSN